VNLAGSQIDCSTFIIVKKLTTCILVPLKVVCIMTKTKEPNVNHGLDTSQNKAVNIAGYLVTSANIVGKAAG
jgi:hypothetical protein